MTRIRNRVRVLAAAALAVAVGFTGLQAITVTQPAEAAVAAQFDPGMIISDALFFDGTAMSASEIQAFLNGKVARCASGSVCLKDYRQDVPGRAAVAGRCEAVSASSNESAASIIARVGAACGISQKALIVLLQKEQGLVTSTSPSSTAYRSATGYGCPDTAACDAQFYGFFNQVYMAALQFKRYAANPTSWNHIPGRINNVRFHPNAACGTSQVLIQNQATAGLYNYTPYQPNGAALANLYGTGDGCSSYGNRNFWTFYTDWFGPTTTSALVRTVDNPLVYLLSGNIRYPVRTLNILSAYSVLGQVSYVSSAYLESFEMGPDAGRIIRNSTGGIYFIDAAIKTLFTSCQMVADYGGSCDPSGYVQLTDAQVAKFVTGPSVTQVLATVEGGRYYLKDGVKHEVLDDASQAAAGIPAGFNVLTEAALVDRPLGAPIVRESVFVRARGQSTVSFLSGGARLSVTSATAGAVGATTRQVGTLLPESLALIPSGGNFTGVVREAGVVSLLSSEGRYAVDSSAIWSTLAPTEVSGLLTSSYPDRGVLGTGSFLKSVDSGAIYIVDGTALRPASSWATLVAVAGTSAPTWATFAPETIAQLRSGRTLLTPGGLYRSAADPQIYLIDGLGTRYRVTTFAITSAAGFEGFQYAPSDVLAQYTNAPSVLSYGVTCNGSSYIAAGGMLRPLAPADVALYPIPFVALDPLTCARTRTGSPAVPYLRAPSGAIYALEGGVKRLMSWSAWVSSGATSWLQVDDGLVNSIPTGAPRS